MLFIISIVTSPLKKVLLIPALIIFLSAGILSAEKKNDPFKNKLFLGIDYHFFSIPTYDYNRDNLYKYKIMDLFSLGPNLYYQYKPYMHFSFIPYYTFSSAVIKFKKDYSAPQGIIKKDKEYKSSAQYFMPSLLIKWQVKENCCSFAFCRESMGLSLITGFAYKALIVQEEKDGFGFQESLPYLITGISIKFFDLKNMLIFYDLKAEIPVTGRGFSDHPLNFQLFNFSMLYKIR